MVCAARLRSPLRAASTVIPYTSKFSLQRLSTGPGSAPTKDTLPNLSTTQSTGRLVIWPLLESLSMHRALEAVTINFIYGDHLFAAGCPVELLLSPGSTSDFIATLIYSMTTGIHSCHNDVIFHVRTAAPDDCQYYSRAPVMSYCDTSYDVLGSHKYMGYA
jgi:hypothetical protein